MRLTRRSMIGHAPPLQGCTPAFGQCHVSKPIHRIVAFHPREGADSVARKFAATSLVRSPERLHAAPVAKLRYRGFDPSQWGSLAAPAGAPADASDTFGVEVNKAMADPGLRERLARERAEPVHSTPRRGKALIATEIVQWRRLVKASAVQVD